MKVIVLGSGVMLVAPLAPKAGEAATGTYRELRAYEGADLDIPQIGGITYDSVRGRLIVADATVADVVVDIDSVTPSEACGIVRDAYAAAGPAGFAPDRPG